MKIVHIMLCGPVTDGWTYQDNMLTKYHRKLGLDVTIITSQWIWGTDGELKKSEENYYINSDGVYMIRLPLKGRDFFWKKIKYYDGLYDSLESEKPDILFVHGVSFGDVPAVVRYIKENQGISVYVDNHSDFSNSGKNWLSRNILHKMIWKYCAKLLEPYTIKFYGVLPARVDWLTEMYGLPEEKCELLVMGADDEEVNKYEYHNVRNEFMEQHGVKQEDFLIVTGGKIDEAKPQTLLLMEAVKEIQNIKLIVFGSVANSLKERLNELADGEKIIFAGWIDATNTYRYFEAADLVVFPGRHSVFWEQAAGQGKPMLCKYWKGTTHLNINDNVWFIEEDTVENIKDLILRLYLKSEDYMTMLQRAQKVKDKFLYSNIAKFSIGK